MNSLLVKWIIDNNIVSCVNKRTVKWATLAQFHAGVAQAGN